MINVLVVAAYPLLREGLKSLVRENPDLRVAGEARFLDEAIVSIRAKSPDVVLLNLDQTEEDDGGVAQLLGAAPRIRILCLTESVDEARVVNALVAGARGAISRDVSADEMGQAIRSVHSDMIVLGQVPAAAILTRLRPLVTTEGIEPLTERELEVLRLMARGLGNRQIASTLGITEHTVKFHIGSILGKLHSSNRTEAVSIALQNGLVIL